MQDATRVLAGDCTVTYEAGDAADPVEQRGAVVVLVKPDNTVLVHDSSGYQPAAWLTRADAVRYTRDEAGFRLAAGKGDERLRIEAREVRGSAHYPASPAGPKVGGCPDCGGALVRDADRVVCTDCRVSYGLPREAAVLDSTCPDCGLPEIRAQRGAAFEVCLDRDCESLDRRVRERFGGEWRCADCGAALEIRRERGLRAVCPACDRSHVLPTGTLAGECDCGLPRFQTGEGTRCLDAECPIPSDEVGDGEG
jgi:DNA topoisomerase-1